MSLARTPAACLGIVVLAYAASSSTLPVPLRAVLCLLASGSLLTWPRRWLAPTIWLSIAAVLGIATVLWRYELANHHFVLTFAALTIGLGSAGPSDGSDPDVRRALALCVALVMGFATAHKLASPTFTSGDYFSHLWNTGYLAAPVSWACDRGAAAVANEAAVAEHVAAPPENLLRLRPVCGLGSVPWRLLALVVILTELWLACLYLLAPAHRASAWSLIGFVVGLVVLREELVFAALISSMGLGAADETWTRARWILTVATCSCAAGAVVRAFI